MTIFATGLDFAKNVFTVRGVNAAGHIELRQPRVSRAKLGELIASLPPGMMVMEPATLPRSQGTKGGTKSAGVRMGTCLASASTGRSFGSRNPR